MKKFIKENWFKILIILFMFVFVGFFGFRQYTDFQKEQLRQKQLEQSKQEQLIILQNENQEFIFDVIRTINEIYKSRELFKDIGDNRSEQFEFAYSLSERYKNARRFLDEWLSTDDKTKKEVSNELLLVLDDFDIAADSLIEKLKGGDDADFTLGLIKMRFAREKLLGITSPIVMGDAPLLLNVSQKVKIIEYIDGIDWFKDMSGEFSNLEENEIEKHRAPSEFWNLLILKSGLQI